MTPQERERLRGKRLVEKTHEVAGKNLMYFMREALARLGDAEAAKAKWFEGQRRAIEIAPAGTPTSAVKYSYNTSALAKSTAADNGWQMSQSTMYATNALVLQGETIIAQNAAIIDLLEKVARRLPQSNEND